LCRPAIEKQRETLKDEEEVLWGDFEHLHHLSVEFERQRYGTDEPPTKEELRCFVETEAVVGEERGLDARAPFFE
jgi:hypothetical protein